MHESFGKARPGMAATTFATESCPDRKTSSPTWPCVTAIWNAFLPERCVVCHRVNYDGYAGSCCGNCHDLLAWTRNACKICGIWLHHPGTCGNCQAQQPAYDSSYIPLAYVSPVSDHIQQLKYQQKLHYARSLADWLIGYLDTVLTDVPEILIPMPLHRSRLSQRGFNQAVEICRPISQHLKVGMDLSTLIRIRDTEHQTSLNEAARIKNMRNAFYCTVPIKFRHVGLIDDVVTSGSTVQSAAKALKQNGVEKVSIFAVARTQEDIRSK